MGDARDILERDIDRYETASDSFHDVLKEASQAYVIQRNSRYMEKKAADNRFVPGKYSSYDAALVRKVDVDTYSVKLASYGHREIS